MMLHAGSVLARFLWTQFVELASRGVTEGIMSSHVPSRRIFVFLKYGCGRVNL